MGSSPSEAAGIILFLAGFTLLAAGFARGGVLWYLLGAAVIAASFFVLRVYRQQEAPGS
jgi:hypothetical protein